MKRVVGFGALNVDNIYQVENLQLEENSAKLIASQPGGSVANTISGLAKLGIATSFVGVVAQDKY
ncbi:MAG: PfkB family carbohydrate kinase, partial [Patescibacteria group bacterium]